MTLVNCVSTKWVARLQNVFSAGKIIALLVIIVMGIYCLAMGKFDTQEDDYLSKYLIVHVLIKKVALKTFKHHLKAQTQILVAFHWPFILVYFHMLGGII